MTPEQEKGIMQAFDAYCKTVLRNKARNLHKELTKQNHFEIPIEDLPPEMEQSMQYWDKYDFSQAVPLGLPEQEMRISDPVLAAAIFQFLPRFRDVLYLAYFMQYSDKEISEQLHLSFNTVRYHVDNLMAKTGQSSRTGLAVTAVMSGIIFPGLD